MNNPDLAIFLYIAIIAVSIMFSPKWGEFITAVTNYKANTGATVSLGGDKNKLANLKDEVTSTSAEATGGRQE